MWFQLRPIDLGFLAQAEKVYVAHATVHAKRADVFRAFADASTWSAWWPGVSHASYGASAPPFGVGTFRESRVDGQRYEETMLAWDHDVRWAYRIDRATLPIANAQLEITEFADDGGGTRITWTIAHDPRFAMRLAAPLMPAIMRRMLARAARGLDAYLANDARRR